MQDHPRPQENQIAYAFDRRGNLLGRSQVDNGTAYFKVEPKKLRAARVFVLPEPPEGVEENSLTPFQLERRQAYEPVLRFDENNGLIVGTIPDYILAGWNWKRCCVRGRLRNSSTIEGIEQVYPVCNAIVHVCEVDRIQFWIEQLSPDILDQLRDDLLHRIPDILPDPPFPDPPFPDPPFPIEPPRGIQFSSARPGTERTVLPQELQRTVSRLSSSTRTEDLRDILISDFTLLRPYLCLLPKFWKFLYSCEEVAVVETDTNGNFEACFWHQEKDPDIYIWVEYPIGDSLVTVYRPAIACNTYWDYNCGTLITVTLHDSRIVPSCGIPLEGTSMAFRAVGHSVSPLAIEQNLAAQVSVPGIANFKTVGLTNYATSYLNTYGSNLAGKHLRPYTGDFPLLGQFGNALPTSGISYFRILYRRIQTAALSPLINPASEVGWKPLNSGSITRQYFIQVGLDFKYEYYNMGPFTVNGEQLYRIPPHDPQDNGVDGNPASTDPSARWSRYDRVTLGRVGTDQLEGNGLYEFRLQFYDSSGNPSTVSDSFFRVPNPSDPDITMAAPADYLDNPGGNSVFQFRLRIDNDQPELAIKGVALNGDFNAMTDCGFVEYNHTADQIRLAFEATHPQGFGLFSFNLERGSKFTSGNTFTTGDANGMVTGSAPPYVLFGGDYLANFSVGLLLAGCGSKAAFSESLTVTGLHTDGYHAGNIFRKSTSNAFALAPTPVP